MQTTLQGPDDWLSRASCFVIKAALLGALVIGLLMSLLVYYEMLQGEWRAKASKLKLEQAYCRSEHVSPQEYQEVCLPARKVIERNAYRQAWDATLEWHLYKLPFVSYCVSHPDMCTMWGTKMVDVIDSLARWLPVILPMLIPMIATFVWRFITKQMCRSRKTQFPTSTSIPNEIPMTTVYSKKID